MHVEKMFHIDHAGTEPALAIGQVKLPHPLETVVEFFFASSGQASLKPVPPFGERAGVMQPEPRFPRPDGDRHQPPVARGAASTAAYRRENVTLDEIRLADILVEGVVLDRDRLKNGAPAILQK